jgi:hypothetical protein
MKKLFLILFGCILLMQLITATELYSPSDIYLDVNTTYPLVLVPLDENVYNMSLNVNDGGNWTILNFTWTGEEYELFLLFSGVGDFPFVVNSTEVEGNLTGVFKVRNAFDVTFRFFKAKQSFPFFSNKYTNDYAYVTAELTGEKTFFTNAYDPLLEPFIAPLTIKDNRLQKNVWYSPYRNGVATLTLYEDEEYAIRLIDGEVTFYGEYSVANITDSYGINAYIGKYTFDGIDQEYNVYLSSRDLRPYRWLLNMILVIGLIVVFVVSVGLFFVVPEFPLTSFLFGIGFSFLLILTRIFLFFWLGW